MAASLESTAPPTVTKPVHTIILDSSPLLLNTPGISTLLAHSHALVTTPSVLSEIRGEEARSRIDTLYKPFLSIRSPKPESVKRVKEFARKTGDGAVLSQTDFEVLALAYDVECERNGGDWRLRAVPGQKRVNGRPPQRSEEDGDDQSKRDETEASSQGDVAKDEKEVDVKIESLTLEETGLPADHTRMEENHRVQNGTQDNLPNDVNREESQEQVEQTPDDLIRQNDTPTNEPDAEGLESLESLQTSTDAAPETQEASDDDEDWITPSNIKKRQAKDEAAGSKATSEQKHLQVATMTGDFAMQNVLLQMNLNLLSTKTCQRISQIKQFVLRCHGCFATTKDMTKQFCPRCGKPTLTRVSCTTNDKGETKLHLKANMQWNNKGNVFSIPKPASGSSNQKWKGPRQGGGQGGWGNELILAEDQKEYIRAMSTMKRTKEKDLMDEDTLPNILTGNRGQTSGRPRVGAGRSINARKR